MIDPDEILTDNSKVEICRQCKTCMFNDGGDYWSNKYDKSCCAVFMHPESKPIEVINNGDCDFYTEK